MIRNQKPATIDIREPLSLCLLASFEIASLVVHRRFSSSENVVWALALQESRPCSVNELVSTPIGPIYDILCSNTLTVRH